MPEAVNAEDYAVVLIWLAICTIYTTLLTVTSFAVVCVLYVFTITVMMLHILFTSNHRITKRTYFSI